MVQLKSSRLAVLLGVFVSCVTSAPQFLDTYLVQKAANSTYTYQSTDGLHKGYSFAYGNTYSGGYKSEHPFPFPAAAAASPTLPPLLQDRIVIDNHINPLPGKNLVHYTGTPVIIHAPNNRSFVKFGLRRPG